VARFVPNFLTRAILIESDGPLKRFSATAATHKKPPEISHQNGWPRLLTETAISISLTIFPTTDHWTLLVDIKVLVLFFFTLRAVTEGVNARPQFEKYFFWVAFGTLVFVCGDHVHKRNCFPVLDNLFQVI